MVRVSGSSLNFSRGLDFEIFANNLICLIDAPSNGRTENHRTDYARPILHRRTDCARTSAQSSARARHCGREAKFPVSFSFHFTFNFLDMVTPQVQRSVLQGTMIKN